MKTFVVLFALAAVTFAAPQAPVQSQNPDATAETLKSVADVGPESYSWEYETSNQIKANEAGQLKDIGTEKGIAAQGAFSYTAPDGTPISLSYVADENGFQPQGDHIPTPPPGILIN
ncbi:larval cuticle protein 65Ag1-like [Sitodiplosis mosellana]|uniref:larval cuticle protein 65Ag1-like n=1 Tax=Sitodiplosis mosellana TaxID=263140 RepID=UPI00244517CA|nr:larval cuticle protein 65Ag1-like [Sitodiplosis mosellana]